MNTDDILAHMKEYWEYDVDTGEFYWIKRNAGSVRVGDPVGSINAQGYIRTRIHGWSVAVHHLVWLLHYKQWPVGDIDHINRNRQDNRLNNLRDVSRSTNLHNTHLHNEGISGHKGVFYNPSAKTRPWLVHIKRNGKPYHRQYYETHELACSVALACYRQLGLAYEFMNNQEHGED